MTKPIKENYYLNRWAKAKAADNRLANPKPLKPPKWKVEKEKLPQIDHETMARHIEASVGHCWPDVDPYEHMARKYPLMHKAGTLTKHMDKAAKKHLGFKSFGHYVGETWHELNQSNPDISQGTNPYESLVQGGDVLEEELTHIRTYVHPVTGDIAHMVAHARTEGRHNRITFVDHSKPKDGSTRSIHYDRNSATQYLEKKGYVLRDLLEDNQVVTESAPPGMEDVVMELKKKYPKDHARAFAIAWSIYNKKHGKLSEETEEGLEILEGVNAAARNLMAGDRDYKIAAAHIITGNHNRLAGFLSRNAALREHVRHILQTLGGMEGKELAAKLNFESKTFSDLQGYLEEGVMSDIDLTVRDHLEKTPELKDHDVMGIHHILKDKKGGKATGLIVTSKGKSGKAYHVLRKSGISYDHEGHYNTSFEAKRALRTFGEQTEIDEAASFKQQEVELDEGIYRIGSLKKGEDHLARIWCIGPNSHDVEHIDLKKNTTRVEHIKGSADEVTARLKGQGYVGRVVEGKELDEMVDDSMGAGSSGVYHVLHDNKWVHKSLYKSSAVSEANRLEKETGKPAKLYHQESTGRTGGALKPKVEIPNWKEETDMENYDDFELVEEITLIGDLDEAKLTDAEQDHVSKFGMKSRGITKGYPSANLVKLPYDTDENRAMADSIAKKWGARKRYRGPRPQPGNGKNNPSDTLKKNAKAVSLYHKEDEDFVTQDEYFDLAEEVYLEGELTEAKRKELSIGELDYVHHHNMPSRGITKDHPARAYMKLPYVTPEQKEKADSIAKKLGMRKRYRGPRPQTNPGQNKPADTLKKHAKAVSLYTREGVNLAVKDIVESHWHRDPSDYPTSEMDSAPGYVVSKGFDSNGKVVKYVRMGSVYAPIKIVLDAGEDWKDADGNVQKFADLPAAKSAWEAAQSGHGSHHLPHGGSSDAPENDVQNDGDTGLVSAAESYTVSLINKASAKISSQKKN